MFHRLPVSLHSVFLIISEARMCVRSVHFYWWTLLLNKVSAGRVSPAGVMNRGDGDDATITDVRGSDGTTSVQLTHSCSDPRPAVAKGKRSHKRQNWEGKGGGNVFFLKSHMQMQTGTGCHSVSRPFVCSDLPFNFNNCTLL